MSESIHRPQRRRALAVAGAWALTFGTGRAAANDAPTGWVQPRLAAPAFRVTAVDGRQDTLAAAVAGKITAVQLMFTGCSATCPVQGALFAAIAPRLPRDVQLLSVSIDVLGDTPASLAAWQARFGRHAAWNAAVADAKDVDRLADFVKGKLGRSGTHTAQVFLFDRQGRLCYRTGDSPAPVEVEALIARIAQLG